MAIGPSMHYGATSVASGSLAASNGANKSIEPAPSRESHVPKEMSLLIDALMTLDSEWSLLSQWLSPALRHEPEAPGNTCEQVEEYRVPLANDIRLARYRVERLIEDVRSASRRIEL